MTLNDFTDGNAVTEAKLDGNFRATGALFIIDVSTDINHTNNTTTSFTSGTPKEYTAISDIGNSDYLIVELTLMLSSGGLNLGSETASVGAQIEIKEIGGSYSDSFNGIIIRSATAYNRVTYKHIHTLTSGEKTNGVQVRLTAKAAAPDSGGGTCYYLNEGVMIYGAATF